VKRKSTASSSPGRRRFARGPERNVADLQDALDALGFSPSRGRGQSFLIDESVAQAEAALVDLAPHHPVVEIGGGFGALTRALIERGFRPITVVEIEPKLSALLQETFGPRIQVILGDALSVPLPAAEAYVGNLPFSAGTPILERLLEAGMDHGVFLVQREVAERLSALPGNREYGPLTILSRIEGEFLLARRVPSNAFYPEPSVEGAIVIFRRSPLEPGPSDRALFRTLVRQIFSWRRKKLRHTLPRVLASLRPELSPEEIALLPDKAGFPADWPEKRPEELSPEELVRLENVLTRPTK
jgi:16S rRNA (adenine1518-N6/adenine1519-N6)-dimethyltransferase